MLLMLAGRMMRRLLRSFFLLILRRLISKMSLTDSIILSDDPDTGSRKCVQLPWSVSLLLLVSPMLSSLLLRVDLISGATRGFFFRLHTFDWTLSILFLTFSDFSDLMSAVDKLFSLFSPRHVSEKVSFFSKQIAKQFPILNSRWSSETDKFTSHSMVKEYKFFLFCLFCHWMQIRNDISARANRSFTYLYLKSYSF